MKRVLMTAVGALLCVLLCSSCFIFGGYNGLMIDYLSTEENYKYFRAKLVDFYYYKPLTHEWVDGFTGEDFAKQDVYFVIQLYNYEDMRGFVGGTPREDIPVEEHRFSLEVTERNCKELMNNGFFEDFQLGDDIEIRASDWIYMDGNFFFIAELKYNDTVYLDLDTGISNMVKMMVRNWTLI